MYSQGEIVLIPVPFSDLSASKKRPVLVISNSSYNATSQDIIVIAVTSNITQLGIPITTDDLTRGVLPKPSVIRSDKIYTLHQDIVVKRIGRIADGILEMVRTDTIRYISSDTSESEKH